MGRAKSRYRKVKVKTWVDEKFRALSPIPPCGQGLWLRLLTGPETGIIPGLFEGREVALADRIGWPLEAYRKAFREVLSQGMAKADFDAGLIWLPNGIYHNEPESPNVVVSWSATWEELPECSLKSEAYFGFLKYFQRRGKAFREAFDKAIDKPRSKPFGKAIDNQEQEQEQEQENSPPSGERSSEPPAPVGTVLGNLPFPSLLVRDEAGSSEPDSEPETDPVGEPAPGTPLSHLDELGEALADELISWREGPLTWVKVFGALANALELLESPWTFKRPCERIVASAKKADPENPRRALDRAIKNLVADGWVKQNRPGPKYLASNFTKFYRGPGRTKNDEEYRELSRECNRLSEDLELEQSIGDEDRVLKIRKEYEAAVHKREAYLRGE